MYPITRLRIEVHIYNLCIGYMCRRSHTRGKGSTLSYGLRMGAASPTQWGFTWTVMTAANNCGKAALSTMLFSGELGCALLLC